MVWIVGPILAVILFVFLIVLICVLRKRRQNTKRPLEAGAVMTPLMSGKSSQPVFAAVETEIVVFVLQDFI